MHSESLVFMHALLYLTSIRIVNTAILVDWFIYVKVYCIVLVFEQKRKQSKKSVTLSSFEQKKKDTEKESAIGRWSKHRNRDQSCITSLLMQTKVK